MTKCPRCAKLVFYARRCPRCREDLGPLSTARVVRLAIPVVLLLLVIGGSLFGLLGRRSPQTAQAVLQSSDHGPPPPDWTYGTQHDAAQNADVRSASIFSANTVNFKFPYSGGSTLKLTVNRSAAGYEAIIWVSNGQIVCNECSVFTNVDGVTNNISFITAKTADVITSSSQPFIQSLRGAHRIVVSVPFFQEGEKQFTFVSNQGLSLPN